MYVAKRSPNPPPWEQGGREGGGPDHNPSKCWEEGPVACFKPPSFSSKSSELFSTKYQNAANTNMVSKKNVFFPHFGHAGRCDIFVVFQIKSVQKIPKNEIFGLIF